MPPALRGLLQQRDLRIAGPPEDIDRDVLAVALQAQVHAEPVGEVVAQRHPALRRHHHRREAPARAGERSEPRREGLAPIPTGRPHGAIHTEARKACGGPPTALCDAEQLRERIDYLRKW